MDLDQIALERALQRDDGLDKKWVGVLHIEVHDSHHADAHELRFEEGLKLLKVIRFYGRGDEFGFLAAAHGRWLNVLNYGHIWRNCQLQCFTSSLYNKHHGVWERRTILLVDLRLDIKVYASDDDIGDDVEGTNAIEDIRIIEGDLL